VEKRLEKWTGNCQFYDKLAPIMGGSQFRRIVVKLGTSTLTAGDTRLSLPRMVELVRQMALLHADGCDIILVTSGAIAAGRERLSFRQLPKAIPAKQMLAAVGQPRLMAIYEQLFALYGVMVAQVLLTRADLSDRRRYLNSRNTLAALLAEKIIPIINENDTVATEEIRVGDNDNLSAHVANLSEAEALILLTDQPGLFTADPRHVPSAELIREVTSAEIPEALWRAAGLSASGLGTGGMVTKLQAADLARRAGAMVVIASGSEPEILLRLTAGEKIGTRFYPVSTAIESRKRFILANRRSPGLVVVDDGAVQALRRGGSLLPVGVVSVQGKFERGDTVRVAALDGHEIARGLINYASVDLERIRGEQSEAIERILGFFYGDEVIHRNNMVLL
jgi:glutamate 5-kinase